MRGNANYFLFNSADCSKWLWFASLSYDSLVDYVLLPCHRQEIHQDKEENEVGLPTACHILHTHTPFDWLEAAKQSKNCDINLGTLHELNLFSKSASIIIYGFLEKRNVFQNNSEL